MPGDEIKKTATKVRYTLRDGSKTYDYSAYKKDLDDAPLPGDYDKKTNAVSKGRTMYRANVEKVVLEKETPKAVGVKAKKISIPKKL